MRAPVKPLEPHKTFTTKTYPQIAQLTNDGDSFRAFDSDGKGIIIRLNVNYDYSDASFDVTVCYEEPIIEIQTNKTYDAQLIRYEKDLKKYNESIKKYEDYKEKAAAKRKIWKEKLKEKERLKELKELERLKKKYEV